MPTAVTEEQVELELQGLKELKHNAIKNERQMLRERSVSIEPFPDGSFEKLLRNNIWKNVLQHLDPASLASAFSTCSSFKSFSEESVIAHVLSLLRNTHFLYLKYRDKNNHDIWNLRLVSKSWKGAMEQTHLNEFSDPSWCVNYPHISPILHPLTQSLLKVTSFIRASNALQQSACGAQLCQVVRLKCGWFQKIFDFLDDYGTVIQGVHLDIYYEDQRTPLDRYLLLVEYLTKLPTLKWLVLENVYLSLEGTTTTANDLVLLRDQIKKSPIPTIQSLELIRFDNWYENELILQEIFRANPHVKSCDLPMIFPVTEAVALQMEKLTSLEAYRVRYASLEPLTQVTRVLSQVNWPLKHLNILQVYQLPTDILFNLINRFASTLEALGLHMDGERLPDLQQCKLELPKLKKMSFNETPWNPDIGLDFLLPCRSLEQLQFAGFFRDNVNSGGTVLVDLVKMEESNIWIWFPRLVCMRIESYHMDLSFFKPAHFVRKGLSRVVMVRSTLDCGIKCRNKFIPDH